MNNICKYLQLVFSYLLLFFFPCAAPNSFHHGPWSRQTVQVLWAKGVRWLYEAVVLMNSFLNKRLFFYGTLGVGNPILPSANLGRPRPSFINLPYHRPASVRFILGRTGRFINTGSTSKQSKMDMFYPTDQVVPLAKGTYSTHQVNT